MNIEKLSSNRVKFTFEVTPEEFEHGLDHAFEHVSKDVEIDGFRKGKIPRSIFEKRFGVESLFEDAINHVLHHKYHDAIAHPDYEIVGDPKIDIDINNVKRGQPFSVSFDCPVKPEVELGDYVGLKATRLPTVVTEEDIKKEIASLLRKESTLEPKDGAIEEGDTAIFDFEGFLDDVPFEGGKALNHELEIGSNNFIPGFESQMIGMKAGDKKDINVTFPESYHAESLAGKPVVFKLTLHEVKRQKTAEATDEWVKTLKRDGVETVAALQENIKVELTEKKATDSDAKFRSDITSQAVENASVDVPEEMIESEANAMIENVKNQSKQYGIDYEMFLSMNGLSKDAFEAQAKTEAKARVTANLVFEAIAAKEGLTPDKATLDQKYEDLAKQYNMDVKDVRQALPESALAKDLGSQMAFDFVIEKAVRDES
ncbi:MAG: trigger factor [Acholeplasmataceae bacterium]|nr:trigger factor [Acholeplasmataceae bacterium]